MDKSLFNKNGDAVAYLTDDYHMTIYLWSGEQTAYLYKDRFIYGINGRHLGWLIDGVVYNKSGHRVGFTSEACPVAVSKLPVKEKKQIKDEIQPRWKDDPLPKLQFTPAEEDFLDFLKEGQVYNSRRGG